LEFDYSIVCFFIFRNKFVYLFTKDLLMKRFLVLACLALFGVCELLAQTNDVVVSAIIKDKDSRKELGNVNIVLVGSNIGTVSNSEGVFSLRVPQEHLQKGLVVSHIGYSNVRVSVEDLLNKDKQFVIWMSPSTMLLKELNVFGGDPRELVEKAVRKIPQNYADKHNMFSSFYRETIQKGRRYIGISEAVANVYKTPYKRQDVNFDRVQVLKGRRLESQKRSDTLAVKIVGGPTIPVYLDVVKNGDEFFGPDMIHCYHYTMLIPVSIDDRMQYAIRFEPRVTLEYALYRGTLYIDQESLAITRAEFELDMSDKEKATQFVLKRKPSGLRFNLQGVSFLVTYRQQDGKTYLNYLRNTVRFKCDWKKRLFASTYTTSTEMVMVDREEQPEEGIKSRDSFKQGEIFYDKVDEYWNEDFWKDYNIIEPTESLESAVKKLKKQY
jgi:hypothetical protein